jgi:CRISP-associated protein Cas1
MSFHIISITEPGVRLSVQRGLLVCEWPKEGTHKTLPLDDVRMVVVQTPHASFTAPALAALLERGVGILHLNRNNHVAGWSMPLHHTVKTTVTLAQVQGWQGDFQQHTLWQGIKNQKLRNQTFVLEACGLKQVLVDVDTMEESHAARLYWKQWFYGTASQPATRERQGAERFENKALNYGYGIVNGLMHQALLQHGLMPQLGLHHVVKYQGTPLVWDAMEAFRPVVDLIVYQYIECHPATAEERLRPGYWEGFYKLLLLSLRALRFKTTKASDKWMDAHANTARTLARAIEHTDASLLWLPDLTQAGWHLDAQTRTHFPSGWFNYNIPVQNAKD